MMPHRMIYGFTKTDAVFAVAGNLSTWVLAAASQNFMWIAAGVASATTSLYMLSRLYYLIKYNSAKEAIEAAIEDSYQEHKDDEPTRNQ